VGDSGTDADSETGVDTEVEIDVAFAGHARECTMTCGTFRMSNVLSLTVDAAEPATVEIEWNETRIDAVVQASWSTPIAAAIVSLPGDGPVEVELVAQVQQCSPGNEAEGDGRFVLTVDGVELELEGTSQSVSGPDEC
jgi:hypothetical protein